MTISDAIAVAGPDGLLRVNDVYHAVQGEGCNAGVPMALIRLHGCSVGCPFCDTKETWRADRGRVATIAEALGENPRWAEVSPAEAAALAAEAAPGCGWALVTGGEPAEQDLAPLARELHARGFRAALETSGTAAGFLGAGFDWVCVSPKAGMPGGRPVLGAALAAADEVKFVAGSAADLDAADALLAAHPRKPSCVVCLQPLAGSADAARLCVAACKARGWRLSVQAHKLIGER